MIPIGCIEKCKGCRHREWSINESLDQKYKFLSSKLSPWVDVLSPVISVSDPYRWGYRHKTTLNSGCDEKGWHFGMMVRDELIDIPECPLHKPEVNGILNILREILPPYKNFPLAYYVQATAQVTLVVKSNKPHDCSWLTDEIKQKLGALGVKGFWIHYNPSAGRRMYEKTQWDLLFGEKRSVDTNCLLYGPGAFQQLIPSLYNQSLDEASTFFNLASQNAVVDLYCGTGTSMSRWAKSNVDILGVEVSGEAIECAKQNVPSANILRGACRQRVPQIRTWVNEQRALGKDVYLYVNPPRTGIEQEVLEWIVNEGKPNKIAYLSCSAGTLSKNLSVLTSKGYGVRKLIPFDFFPQTVHVECLALIEKEK